MSDSSNKKIALLSQPWMRSIIAIVVIFGSLAVFLFWHAASTEVSIDTSVLDAPTANIAPTSGGILNALYVADGDRVPPNAPIAQVGTETLFTKEGGIVSGEPQALGSYFAPGQRVISVINNERMRVAGTIEETKGLERIKEGQRVTFTVDAFGSKSYSGVVDEISSASNDAGIAFSISDKRPVRKFTVYVRFNTSAYPELKDGMSAKMTVYTD
jgi:multidrug resistance efflux pump